MYNELQIRCVDSSVGHKNRFCRHYTLIYGNGEEEPADISSKRNILTIEHLNAQSQQCNLDEVGLFTKDRNNDILYISESWLLSHIPDVFVNIPNYNIFRCESGRDGGVCIYVKDLLSANVIDLKVPKQIGIEDICLQYNVGSYQQLLLDVSTDIPKLRLSLLVISKCSKIDLHEKRGFDYSL